MLSATQLIPGADLMIVQFHYLCASTSYAQQRLLCCHCVPLSLANISISFIFSQILNRFQWNFGEVITTTLAPRQRVLHAAARTVLDLKLGDHVTPALRELHWLPITENTVQASAGLTLQGALCQHEMGNPPLPFPFPFSAPFPSP